MKPALFQFFLFVVITLLLSACDPAMDFAHEEAAPLSAAQAGRGARGPVGDRRADEAFGLPSTPGAACSCFSQASLSNEAVAFSANGTDTADYYLFFDVFNYYGLDARRTEARALVSTPAGLLEEVAAVYITYGSGPNDLHLICHRQEVVSHPVTGEPTYHYETLAPSVEEAEACRQAIVAAAGDEEPCQGAACGIPYSKEQLSPEYPGYNDNLYRTPKALLDAMQREVKEVGQMLQLPA